MKMGGKRERIKRKSEHGRKWKWSVQAPDNEVGQVGVLIPRIGLFEPWKKVEPETPTARLFRKERIMIHASIERCAGIDVGKKWLSVCIMVGPLPGEPRVETRRYGTIRAQLIQLREWLQQEGITHVVMESTGSYWKPIFNELENAVKVYLANPQGVKNRKGHKTDDKDGWWLAHLLRHAMIHPSFIPPRAIRELRDLTRYRKRLIGNGTSERNRLQKILEDANVKLGNVLTDVFGVSGQLMLEALIKGESPEQVAQYAKRAAKRKVQDIVAALEGHQMNQHHRRMIGYHLDHMKAIEKQLSQLDRDIEEHIREAGLETAWKLMQSVPGIKAISAATILAETGDDMSVFPSERNISSWAGVCPGNNWSAGKSKGARSTKGNSWLRAALTECAWAAASKKGCFLKEKLYRIAAKHGGKKPPGLFAVSHTLLVLIYEVLRTGKEYQERQTAVMTESQRERAIRHHIRRLGKLGVAVSSARPACSPRGTALRPRRRGVPTAPLDSEPKRATKKKNRGG
jgi:transposase